MLNILVAEDNRAERLLLVAMLEAVGYHVVAVENGEQALKAYQEKLPDLVLLDVLLGQESGHDIALAMRAMQTDIFIPVVFITGLSLQEDIVECLKVGDDVIQKPFQAQILLSKVAAMQRIKALYSKLIVQRDEITFHRNAILREQDFAKKIYDRIAHSGTLNSEFIRYYISPQAFFNGDVVLAAYHPLGGLLFFIGDFTGHGLPAALGALPLSEMFYTMTSKGYSVSQILRAMNQKLREILPSEIFCAATMLYIDGKERFLQAWNGGLPPARIRYKDGKPDLFIKSSHLPLGILEELKFNSDPEYIEINNGDHIFLFSDGVYEAFGSDDLAEARRLIDKVFDSKTPIENIFQKIIGVITKMKQADTDQRDDITLVDITVAPFNDDQDEALVLFNQNRDKIDWHLSLTLGPNSLRFFDPLPIVLQVINEVPPLRVHSSRIYTILSEMFSNALEHGILQLASNTKSSAQGFHDYYEIRKQALQKLESGTIEFEVSFFDENESRYLKIRLKDSGPGFDDTVEKKGESLIYCGRGITLLRSLCQSVRYLEHGTVCEAVYRWR